MFHPMLSTDEEVLLRKMKGFNKQQAAYIHKKKTFAFCNIFQRERQFLPMRNFQGLSYSKLSIERNFHTSHSRSVASFSKAYDMM